MTASREPLRIGMIGAGFIAQVAHLHAFSRIEEARIVALSEPHDGLRTAVARRFGIETATADYRDLLRGGGLDAVIVCVPRRCQSWVVAEVFSTRLAVLSEKPMAMTLLEAERLVAAAKSSNARWMVGYMKRHDIGVRRFAERVAELCAQSRLGRILDVSMCDFCATYAVAIPDHVRRDGPRPLRYPEAPAAPDFVPEAWRADYEYTANVASHDVNLLRMILGVDLAASAFSVRRGGAQRAILDAVAYPVSLVVAPADVGRWNQRIDVTFACGRASLVLPSPFARQESAVMHLETAGRTEVIKVPAAEHIWAFEAQARSFVEAVAAQREPESSGADSLADVALIDSLWRKAECR